MREGGERTEEKRREHRIGGRPTGGGEEREKRWGEKDAPTIS